MKKRWLLTTGSLGVVVTLVGLTGVLSVFTDRATTGENKFETGEVARHVDLYIAPYEEDADRSDCGAAWADDLTTGLFSVTGAEGGSEPFKFFCLKNDGSQAVDLSVSALDLADVDFACTGDEESADSTCGKDLEGEVSGMVEVQSWRYEWDGQNWVQGTGNLAGELSFLATTPGQMGANLLDPGEVELIMLKLVYNPSEAEALIAQSDRATWRFAFDGTTAA